LKLLAPTVLVSMVLVAACIFGLFYLNSLHINAADVLSENVKSTSAARTLESAAENLLHGVQDHPNPDRQRIQERYQETRKQLGKAQALANLPPERALVQQISDGLDRFEHEMSKGSAGHSSVTSQSRYEKLAGILERDVLRLCARLKEFNAGQIEESDRENQEVLATLRWGLLAVGLGGPLIGLLLGFAVARSLSHSIYQLSVRIRDAAGRLNRDLGSVTVEEKDDLPDLHRQMQGVIEEIERVVEQYQQREREVLRAEQLAAVGQVAAGVAHELRNPLTSVKMLVQTGLEGDGSAGLPPEDLAVIEREIRRMEQCIQVFIDFARPPQSERRRTDLTAILRRAVALVEGRARRQKVTLSTDLPLEAVYLEVDPEQVHQVAVNLLLNALDALPRGGTVLVAMSAVPAGPDGNGDRAAAAKWVQVRVEDSGPGIAPRIKARLFEPFVSSKETGLGLGLSISRRLVEAHAGSIRGENSPDGGAVFTFILPVSAIRDQGSGIRDYVIE
jgi:signal transduction histidine kinase